MARLGYASEALFDRTVTARQFALWEAWAETQVDAKVRAATDQKQILDPW